MSNYTRLRPLNQFLLVALLFSLVITGCRKKAKSDDSTDLSAMDIGPVLVVSGNQPATGDTVVVVETGADGSNIVIVKSSNQSDDGLPNWDSFLGSFTVAEDSPVNKIIVATELKGTVAYALDAAASTCDDGHWNPNVYLDGKTGILTGTPRDQDVGTCTVAIKATGSQGTLTGSLTVSVLNTNDLPVWITELGDRSASDYTPFVANVLATDADAGEVVTYSFDAGAMSCDDGGWSPTLIINAVTGLISGTPTIPGTCTVVVKAKSGSDVVTSGPFTITVIDVPNLPSWATLIGNRTVAEDAPFSAVAAAIDPDAGDVPFYTIDLATSTCDNGAWNPALTIDSSTGILSGTPTNADALAGSCTITIVAQSGPDTLTQSFTVTIPNTADFPTWNPTPADFAWVRDQPLNGVYAQAIDVDPGETPTYALDFANMTCDDASPAWPTPIAINATTGALGGVAAFANVGTCTIRIKAMSGGDAIYQSVTLTVTDSSLPPTWNVTISDQATAEDAAFTVTAVATDPDNSVTYALDPIGTTCDDDSSWSPALGINAATGVITGTPTNSSVGACAIKIVASGGGQTIYDTFQLTVTNTDDPPTWVQTIGNFSMGDNTAIAKTASAVDVDPGATIVYSLDLANMTCDDGAWSPNITINATTGVLSGHPMPTDAGICTVKIQATSASVTINQTFSITILDATGPAVSVAANLSSPTSVTTIPFTVTFTEDVTGFALADISVSNGTKGNFAQSTAKIYTFDVTAATGTVQVSIPAGSAQDAASNANFLSNTVNVVTLQGINVDSSASAINVNNNLQYYATGIYSDNSSVDLTTAATWTSTTPAVASVGASGLAAGVGGGSTNIRASLGGKQGQKALTVNAATLNSIAVTPINPRIGIGGSIQFSATGTYSDGSNQDLTGAVTWASTDAGKATVSNAGGSKGFAAAVATGTATISATLGAKSASTVLTVTAATLIRLEVAPIETSAPAGTTRQFYATAIYSDGSYSDVTSSVIWTSSVPVAATINSNGLVAHITTGASTIQAALGADSGSTTVTVLPATLQSIAVTPANLDIPIGMAQKYTATGSYSDGSTWDLSSDVTWTTTNATYATANNAAGSKGFITGVANGSVNVQATLGAVSGQSGLDVTTATLSSVAVTPGTLMLSKLVSKQFSATATFSDATQLDVTNSVVWSSSNNSYAMMGNSNNDRGYFYNLYNGASTQVLAVTAALGGKSGAANVVITIGALTSILINPTSATATVGTDTTVKAYGQYNDGASLDITDFATWTSSDLNVAQASNAPNLHGVVRAMATGSSNITAKLGGISATLPMTVSSGAATQTTEGVGLTAQYFNGKSFNTLKGTRIDSTVNFYWGTGNSPLDVADFFSVRWTGKILAKDSGTVTIKTNSDDGVRMWFNGSQIINNWTDHSVATNSATVTMVAGQKYDVTLEFYENGGYAQIDLLWQSASTALQMIPRQYLFPE